MPTPEGYGRIKAPEDAIEAAKHIKRHFELTWGDFVWGAILQFVQHADYKDVYKLATDLTIDGRGDMDDSELREAVLAELGL